MVHGFHLDDVSGPVFFATIRYQRRIHINVVRAQKHESAVTICFVNIHNSMYVVICDA